MYGSIPGMKVTEQIRKLVAEAPISQYRICMLADISPANLSEFMSGKRGLSLRTLDALGMVLGLTVTMDHAKLQRLAKEAPASGRPVGKRNSKAKEG